MNIKQKILSLFSVTGWLAGWLNYHFQTTMFTVKVTQQLVAVAGANANTISIAVAAADADVVVVAVWCCRKRRSMNY